MFIRPINNLLKRLLSRYIAFSMTMELRKNFKKQNALSLGRQDLQARPELPELTPLTIQLNDFHATVGIKLIYYTIGKFLL